MSTRETIIAAARDLFGEEGYTAVTIKDVAARAGYSPAMVMKVMGSKAQLYAASAPTAPVDPDSTLAEPLGFQLVRRLADRRDRGEPEPWAMAPMRVHDAPDKNAAREEIRQKYLAWLSERLPSQAQQHAEAVMAMLLGLASGMRTLDLFADVESEDFVQTYGSLLQQIIDS